MVVVMPLMPYLRAMVMAWVPFASAALSLDSVSFTLRLLMA